MVRAADPIQTFFVSLPLAFTTIFLIGASADLPPDNWAVFDEREFHLPLANHFVRNPVGLDFPTFGATAPGTHVFAAMLARLLGLSEIASSGLFIDVVFGLVGAITLSLLVAFCHAISRSRDSAFVLALPLLSTTYFLLPATFLVTEGLSYLGYVVALGSMLFLRSGAGGAGAFVVGAGAMALSRQIFLPVACAYALKALPFGSARTWRDLLPVAAGTLAPWVLLAPIFLTWGGLVPQEYQFHETHEVNWPVLIQIVGLTGILGLPFLAISRVDGDAPRLVALLMIAVAAALALWLLMPTAPGRPLSREFSVVWRLADVSPLVLGRPILLLIPLIAGCVVILHHLWMARCVGRIPVEWGMFGAYTVALMSQTYAWQRYAEAPLLITLAVSTAYALAPRRAGLALFVVAFGLYLMLSVGVISGMLNL